MIVYAAGSESGRYFYHFDGQGNVIALSNSSGNVVEEYEYDVYGLVSVQSLGQTWDRSQYGNPYLFTGRRWDGDTGLYYYRARMYSPDLGRFLQPDPLGYFDGMNVYAYCGNNPVNWIDPWGLCKDGAKTGFRNLRGSRFKIVNRFLDFFNIAVAHEQFFSAMVTPSDILMIRK